MIITTPDNVPIVMMLFIMLYFTWYAMRKATVNDMRMAEGKGPLEKEESEQKVLVFPYLIFIEFVVALFYSIMLVVWSLALKAPLEDPANPSISPNPSKAPWYFLGLQELLVYFDPWIAGVLLPTLIIIGLCAIPYLDRSPKGSGYYSYQQRRVWISGFLFCFWMLWIVLIVLGTFLRGPNWNFFGPFEVWNVHKVVPLLNVNLSEFVFIKWLGWGLPSQWYLRELPGILLVLAYLLIPPAMAAKTFCKKAFQEMGAVRYAVAAFLLLMVIAVPIKMYLRWAFNLKYLVAIPEFFFNI
ncbi:MAG: cytochrome C [Candidatus Omnitrophica bacterium CG11_big_fil_rev_8_21_14_0_20_45_26]|uniref:Cytochrome C n=1 Tax=Candidatus Abzuiibacterium crystallinum TaxID=1974748 RepID=A0A2H0LRQ6_9BACT|nr:MAG: cytochrome C [Candidatus Omnitrophica bacterium CG11_big_fil_rev_8_21_14_0_20_45_26]PIW65740.1 MAG: cytochrome C [Candidatus Omnitrophica bacterium CG12_big_fil_rev_8_21_14_0_65_45_16]